MSSAGFAALLLGTVMTATAAAAPKAPLDRYVVTLERTMCFGTCPSYVVEIRGDGQVTYTGRNHVDVVGEHRYTIPAADVARLVGSLNAKNLWAAKPRYVAGITDQATTTVTIEAGKRIHRIVDYAGARVGMPAAIGEFQREIDAAAGTGRWIRLSVETVEQLGRNGFDFASDEGGRLLWRAVARDDGGSDTATRRLLERGAPTNVPRPEPESRNVGTGSRSGNLLDVALDAHKPETADWLIAHGALAGANGIDRAKVDAAFRAAVSGGRLAGVRRVWDAAGDTRPSLEAVDAGDVEHPAGRVPVSLLLDKRYGDTGWEGLAIAQWLAERGCDLAARGANGRTLLHAAAAANDAAFVRYLLAQGLDPSTPGAYGLPALGSTQNEDVALLLLDAGTDLAPLSDKESNFRRYAVSQRWSRVIAWLDARGR